MQSTEFMKDGVKSGVLYVSYDGILEPLGQSQVLAYLERLAQDRPIHLISFEKPEDWGNIDQRKAIAKRISAAGICWYPLRYHKSPSAIATAWDIFQGIILGWWLIVRHGLRIIHARSYVPSVMALILKRLTGSYFLFDMRGFWADERVDGGLWHRDSRLYKIAKWFERQFLLNADHVVSLTQAAVKIMQGFDYLQGKMPPSSVIPTCADLNRFKPSERYCSSERFVLGYVGSAGTWYQFDAVAVTVATLLRLKPNAYFLVVNRGEHEYIRQCLKEAGVPEQATEIVSATHAEVPMLMARMHAGIFFIKPLYSKQASAPTKLAEFLGCGLPCLVNAGVGDMAEIVCREKVGVVIDTFEPRSLEEGLKQLLLLCDDPDISNRCTIAAHRYFSLDNGVEQYKEIYKALEERTCKSCV